jgi:predicted Zn-dependent protease
MIATIASILTAVTMAALSVAAQTPKSATGSFEELAAKADEARAADQIDHALDLYRKALALRPTWAEGWFYVGTLHYDRNEYEAASRAFRRVTVLQPKSGTASVMLGLSEFQLGQDDLALKHLEAAEVLGMANEPALRKTALLDEALLLQRKSRFDAARVPLDSLCHDHAETEETLRLLGMVQLRLRTEQAGNASTAMLSRLGQAGCLAAQKRLDEARTQYESVVNEFTAFPDIHYAFGNFLLEVPDISASRQQFEREIANNPQHVLARLKIASALYRTDSEAGIRYAEEALKLDPKVALGHYLLGLLLLDVDDFKRAIPELEAAKPGFTQEPKLFFALGSAYARAGRAEEAERARAEFKRLESLQKKTQEQ